MSFSQCHLSHIRRLFMRREDHLSSLMLPSLDMSAPLPWSLTRKAQGPYLQQLGEYYLHSRWKGSRLHLQISECYLHIRWKGPHFLRQHKYCRGAKSPWFMRIQLLISRSVLLAKRQRRSFSSSGPRMIFCSGDLRVPNGPSHI